MINLRKQAGFHRIKSTGPVTLFLHSGTGKYVCVTRHHMGQKWLHQGREVTLQQLVTRKKLVTLATADQHYEQAVQSLGVMA